MPEDNASSILTTRIIIRNLPSYASEDTLKKWVLDNVNVAITDVRVPKTKEGKSRRIGFIGVPTPEDTARVIDKLKRVFFDTSKVICSPAFPPESKNIPRPWSRHVPGSSAYERYMQKKQELREKKQKKKDTKRADASEGNRISLTERADDLLKLEFITLQSKRKGHQTWSDAGVHGGLPTHVKRQRKNMYVEPVKPTKAGMAALRSHIEFDQVEDNADGNDESTQSAAYDASISESAREESDNDDPIAWLKRCSEAKLLNIRGTEKMEKEDIKVSRVKEEEEEGDVQSKKQGVGDTEKESGEGDVDNAKHQEEALIGDTGRLLVLNLPYSVTEAQLKDHFSTYGEVAQVHICYDEKKIKSVGRAFIQYAFPTSAVKAASELHMSLFQGRIIRIKGAYPPVVKKEGLENVLGYKKKATSSYKRKQEENLKKIAENPVIWNLLYVSANSAIDSAVQNLNVDKRDVLGLDVTGQDSVAARVALGETHVIQKTKQWLETEGLSLSAFERQGVTLLASRPLDVEGTMKRMDDTIIVKHLPSSVTQEELSKLFSQCGSLLRCSLSPSKTVAVVQFLRSQCAKACFSRFAFSRIRTVPLFLEWAPESLFVEKKSTTTHMASSSTTTDNNLQQEKEQKDASHLTTQEIKDMLDEEDETTLPVSLFIKNLNFLTTDESLCNLFKTAPGFVSAVVMKKKKSVPNTDGPESIRPHKLVQQSMGYGFVEFNSAHSAKEAMKRFQGASLDDHNLELSVSQCARKLVEPTKIAEPLDIDLESITNKLTVRNLAFQATKHDLRRLFGAFGNVVAVRIPKKPDGTSRGYGFVEFMSRSDALNALEALQHTHLYGRKMVLEPSRSSDVDPKSDNV